MVPKQEREMERGRKRVRTSDVRAINKCAFPGKLYVLQWALTEHLPFRIQTSYMQLKTLHYFSTIFESDISFPPKCDLNHRAFVFFPEIYLSRDLFSFGRCLDPDQRTLHEISPEIEVYHATHNITVFCPPPQTCRSRV